MVLIALAAATALSHDAGAVAVGCHAGDAALFPDCRPTFLDAAWQVLDKATEGRVRLLRPYAHKAKAEVVARGVKLGVPFERTWSCYRGGEQQCGECLACTERRSALHPFVLERVENPHPKMLAGALEARAAGGPYWDGYLRAMADATGEPEDALIAWMERVG